MNKTAVKVVKRNKKGGTKKTKNVISAPKVESDVQPRLVNIVNNWISERRANRQAEKAFSDGKISGWKIMSENF